MQFYSNAPIWNDAHCPHTCATAKPGQSLEVRSVTAIDVIDDGGWYRDANFSGRFIVADANKIPRLTRAYPRIPVYCLWFGHRLKVRTPQFLFDMSKCTVIPGYSGRVDINLAL